MKRYAENFGPVSGIFLRTFGLKKGKKVVSEAAIRHGNHELPCRTAERPSDRYPHPFGHDHQRVEGRTEGVAGSGRFGVCLFLGRKRKIKKWFQKGFDNCYLYWNILDISPVWEESYNLGPP